MESHLPDCRIHIYADDTAISVNGRSVSEIEEKLNNKLRMASEWMVRNHLTLNCTKTNMMYFGTAHTLQIIDRSPPIVQSDDSIIQSVEEFKYLGVVLESKISFTNHVEYLIGKGIGHLKMLGRTCKFVDEETSLQLYKTLMSPIFDYADVVYDCLNVRDSHALQKLQNSALRIVLKRDRRSHVADSHKDTNLHYLADRRHFHMLNQVYKCVNELVPDRVSRQLK